MDYVQSGVLTEIEVIICGCFTPRWKVLYDAEICAILLPLSYVLHGIFGVQAFAPKPWTIVSVIFFIQVV